MSNSIIVMVYQDISVLEEALKQFKVVTTRSGYTWLTVPVGERTRAEVEQIAAKHCLPTSSHQAAFVLNGKEEPWTFTTPTAAILELAQA